MAEYLRRPTKARAERLSWGNLGAVSALMEDALGNDPFQGVFVSDDNTIQFEASKGTKVGLLYPVKDGTHRMACAIEGEWLVYEEDKLFHVSDEDFRLKYMENE